MLLHFELNFVFWVYLDFKEMEHSNSNLNSGKLKTQLLLLQKEYDQLHRNFMDLEHKYNAMIKTCDKDAITNGDSVYAQLANTVESLYGQNLYSDVKINLCSQSIGAHKLILHARSSYWQDNEHLDSVQELDWSNMKEEIASGLLRWLYTDQIDIQDDLLALGLLKVSHQFNLPRLLAICEQFLISTAKVGNCVRYYCEAEKVQAKKLLDYCSELISLYWNDLMPQDFAEMSQPLMYKMLYNKTKYPLHAAIRLLREDVVQQYLDENKEKAYNNFSKNNIKFFSFILYDNYKHIL